MLPSESSGPDHRTAPLINEYVDVGALDSALASHAKLVEHYRKTELTAFKEVEAAANSVRRLRGLENAATQAKMAYDISYNR